MATILQFPIRTEHDQKLLIERGRELIRHNGWNWRMVLERVLTAQWDKMQAEEMERKRKVELWSRWP